VNCGKQLIESGCYLGGVSRGFGLLDGGGDCQREGAILGVNVGLFIVTSGDFVASVFSAMRGGDTGLPKLLWDFLFLLGSYHDLKLHSVK